MELWKERAILLANTHISLSLALALFARASIIYLGQTSAHLRVQAVTPDLKHAS